MVHEPIWFFYNSVITVSRFPPTLCTAFPAWAWRVRDYADGQHHSTLERGFSGIGYWRECNRDNSKMFPCSSHLHVTAQLLEKARYLEKRRVLFAGMRRTMMLVNDYASKRQVFGSTLKVCEIKKKYLCLSKKEKSSCIFLFFMLPFPVIFLIVIRICLCTS